MFGITSRSPMTRYAAAAAGLALAFVAACDSEPTAPTMVVASNTVIPAAASVVNAVAAIPFSFPAGAGALDASVANQNLVLTFGGTATAPTANMVITTAAGATTGTITTSVTFGSCIFVVTQSTFPTGSRLATGQTIVVNPCNINVQTAGVQANGVGATRSVALALGAAVSAGGSITVNVNPGGQLTLNGNTVGTVTLVPVSG